jgi:acetyltransferase-like isoleucine patch superfamily enzyme
MPNPTGRRLRYFYYKNKLNRCGRNVLIDTGVIIENPQYISIGDNVWIDKYTLLMAGPVQSADSPLMKKDNADYHNSPGELTLGSGIHIGAFNIIQAHGGVSIADKVTTSAGVKIYSFSNYPYDDANRQKKTYANCMVNDQSSICYISSPIVIEEGVWIGLDCLVLGGTIGKNSFITSQSLVLCDIPVNSYATGNPAKKIKSRFEVE